MRTRRQGASAAAVLARAGVLTAMSAAALFMVDQPSVSADGCIYDSGGTIVTCWVDSESGGDPWDVPGGGSGGGGYESGGGDGGGGEEELPPPPGDPEANRRRGAAAQENGHMRMRDGQCFTAITGMSPTSANRATFARDVERFTIVGRAGRGGSHGLAMDPGPTEGTYVISVYDNFGEGESQTDRDLRFLLAYVVYYGQPTTLANVIRRCGD